MITYCVTKHCNPANLENMLAGHFRIGTTRQYSNIEGGGLFDDKKEGSAARQLLGDQHITSMVLPGGHVIENVTMSGVKIAISHEFNVDAHVFCTSNGDYSAERHQALISGNDRYKPNADYTHYAVLDKLKLSNAIVAAVNEAAGSEHDILGEKIRYEDRASGHLDQLSFNNPTSYALASRRAVFHKPANFLIEDEYRYLAIPRSPPATALAAIDTKHLSEGVQSLFRDAIIRHGQISQSPCAQTSDVSPAAGPTDL